MASSLMANILQGGVALFWLSGLQRFAGPISAAFKASALEFVLVLPILAVPMRLFQKEGTELIRVDQWIARLGGSEGPVVAFSVLALGSGAIFLFQELIPLWKRVHERPRGGLSRDPRLDLGLGRVLAGYYGKRSWRGRTPIALLLESSDPIASLQGFFHPRILISRTLLSELDDQELDGVLAHEIAHAAFGGNLRMVFLWGARALQLLSPAALIAFRGLLEQRERACDELAVNVTGRPAALASALLRVQEEGRAVAGTSAIARARAEVERRIELETTRARVRALLDIPESERHSGQVPWYVWALTGSVMGGILWAIR